MTLTPRPSSFPAIGAYITSTHVVLVVTALAAPLFSSTDRAGTPQTIAGIAMVVLVSALGSVALLTEHAPDGRFSKWWRRPVVVAAWSVLLVLASIVLATVGQGGARDIAATVFPLVLAFRTIAAGSFWRASARVAVAALACYFSSRVLHGFTGLDTGDPTLTIAVAAVIAFAVIGQDTVYALALEVDDLRTTEAQRAVNHERQRFAGDLHDIQGQNLQLLAAEAQIVQRLLDAQRYNEAGEHAAKLGQIAATAVEDMRSVVHAYRDVGLTEEAANAVRVLEAAGITVDATIEPPAQLADSADRLLGLTIREGITNVLRHTRTRDCRLTVSKESDGDRPGVLLLLADSGPSARAPQTKYSGSGITALARRYAEAGGSLTFATTETAGSSLEGWLPISGERTQH